MIDLAGDRKCPVFFVGRYDRGLAAKVCFPPPVSGGQVCLIKKRLLAEKLLRSVLSADCEFACAEILQAQRMSGMTGRTAAS